MNNLIEKIADEIAPAFGNYLKGKKAYYSRDYPCLDESTLRKLIQFEIDKFFSQLKIAVSMETEKEG